MRFARKTMVPTLVLAAASLSGASLAHGPTPQRVSQSITIAAAPAEVWKRAGDFAGIKDWHPAVERAVASGGNQAGGKRTLTLRNGGTLDESLDEWDGAKLSYSYRLGDADLKALPVSSYSATLTVSPDGSGSKVEWKGRFYRGDTGNEPPETLTDEAGNTAMNAYFSEGLKGLKAAVEGKATQ